MARTYGLAILPWSPLAGGFLTGKYRRGQQPPPDARMQPHATYAEKLLTNKAFDAVESLERIAERKGCTVGALALAWCMRQPGITSPIIGPRTVEQLQDNLRALNVAVSDDDRRDIDMVVPPGHAVVNYYSAGFSPHRLRW